MQMQCSTLRAVQCGVRVLANLLNAVSRNTTGAPSTNVRPAQTPFQQAPVHLMRLREARCNGGARKETVVSRVVSRTTRHNGSLRLRGRDSPLSFSQAGRQTRDKTEDNTALTGPWPHQRKAHAKPGSYCS